MGTQVRRMRLFSRDARRPGRLVYVAPELPEADRAALAQRLEAPVIFSDALDIERASADIRGPDGKPVALPDACFAAYRVLVEADKAPLKRLRFMAPEGEVQVQGEYFRPTQSAQIWREAPTPTVRSLEGDVLGPALGPLLGLEVQDVLSASEVVTPGVGSTVVVLLKDLAACAKANVGHGVATWAKAQGVPAGVPWVLHSAEASVPLFDGHVRVVRPGEGAVVDGSLAATALVVHWTRAPRQMAFNAELGDGKAVVGQVAVWVEGEPGAPERLSIGGHVLDEGEVEL